MMIDIYKTLGIEKLINDPDTLFSLKEYIKDNARLVTPGYCRDYYLFTFQDDMEFDLCKDLTGLELGVDIHFSGSLAVDLKFNHIISDEGTTALYSMGIVDDSAVFPVRIVCPDVLADPQLGDIIRGQLIAVAGSEMIIVPDAETGISDAGDGNARIIGEVKAVIRREFKYLDVQTTYWEIKVETVLGDIPVLVSSDIIDRPEEGSVIIAECLLSLDVGIIQKWEASGAWASNNRYEGKLPDKGIRYGDGFVPSAENAERVFMRCVREGDFLRFARCCTEDVIFEDAEGNRSISFPQVNRSMSDLTVAASGDVALRQITRSSNESMIGRSVIAFYNGAEVKTLLHINADCDGYVDKLSVLDPDGFELGIDKELRALSILAESMCNGKMKALPAHLNERCYYRSDYADKSFTGADRILRHLHNVAEKLDETCQYTYRILPATEVLCRTDDLPLIYRGHWCAVEHQAGKLAAFIFVMVDPEGRIKNILLSRNRNYLKEFAVADDTEPADGAEPAAAGTVLRNCYGERDLLRRMREEPVPDEDTHSIYIWKQADDFVQSWLRQNDYMILTSELEEDCIGYSCERRGKPYAVYLFARGENRSLSIDAEYCQRLREYPLSQGKEVLILYLRVEKQINEEEGTEYKIGRYDNAEYDVEPWILQEVEDRILLVYYPYQEICDMVDRLMAAFNTQDLDVLRAICMPDVTMESGDNGRFMNHGFYSNLNYHYREYGKMKVAYIRNNDMVFSKVPYLDGDGYITFRYLLNEDRISEITWNPLDDSYRELLVTDIVPEAHPLNAFPALREVDYLPTSVSSRFSARLTFENGEIRRYDFHPDPLQDRETEEKTGETSCDDEIAMIGRTCFTDKIFQHGRIVEHIALPHWMGYKYYPQRGQGIEFANGYAISTAELYTGSYPIEVFSYAGMGGIFVLQHNYSDDGYAVGRISNLDPSDPLYLLDRNTMLARKLPDVYQNTQIILYPSCGGYTEGRIMVNTVGELDLRYHHNFMGCSGMWGWLDTDFHVVIEPQYVFAMNFYDGQAIVCRGNWSVTEKDGREQYWCDNEQWGVIDPDGNEIVPCEYDELYRIENTNRLFFVHQGGWEKGNYAIYDIERNQVILELDFDFDMGYMFNQCFLTDDDLLVFVEHQPGEGLDLLYAYDLQKEQYLAYRMDYTERTFRGEKRVVIQKDGEDIIVF